MGARILIQERYEKYGESEEVEMEVESEDEEDERANRGEGQASQPDQDTQVQDMDEVRTSVVGADCPSCTNFRLMLKLVVC